MKRLILLRHGQSQWNLENRFTGWTDVELTEKGIEEAKNAGRLLLNNNMLPDICFTSVLKRAIHTAQYALMISDRDWIPMIKDWHLNERHYGALQGLNKSETAKEYGEATVHEWRRSFDEIPPLLSPDDERYAGRDERYNMLATSEIPLAESLRDTIARVRCCWEEQIVPALRMYRTVLVSAHGNSLRGLAKTVLDFTATEIVDVEIPTGRPWIIELNERLEHVRDYYL